MRAAASYKPLTHIRSTSLRAIMRTAAAALAAVTLLLVGFGGRVTATVNAAGKPVLTPSRVKIAGHDIYFESPPRPSGLLIIMHKCGRSGSDHWPRSKSCLECEGVRAAPLLLRLPPPFLCCALGGAMDVLPTAPV